MKIGRVEGCEDTVYGIESFLPDICEIVPNHGRECGMDLIKIQYKGWTTKSKNANSNSSNNDNSNDNNNITNQISFLILPYLFFF